mmetsp:Transcript_17795/g.17505  ORF Transcript_17795/g.17505 Transcript_17795/m.17505 type:complete len:185 (+) Transcript_17795:663-1217(+)
MYTSGDADNPNFGKDLSQTFDMGLKPVVIPMLDMKRLNHVKTFKDWYGYSQKLEKSLKLLLGRIKSLQNERADFTSKLMKVKSQNQNLYKLNEKLNNTIKKLNIRLKEASNLRQRFEMTMPSMGSNYVSFTMSDNHKTAKNKKNFSNSDMNDNVDGLNRSFCTSDIESQSNLAKEVNQYLQNSS